MIIDSHCHLDGEAFNEDRGQVIERARAAGVEAMLAIGTGNGPPDVEAAVRLAEMYPDVWATVGVHPHEARKANAGSLSRIEALCGHPRVLAVGEIGLDYHYDHSPRDVQRRVFIEQMAVARRVKKPIIIHTREAWDDTLDLLKQHWQSSGLGVILHCFSGAEAEARQGLDLGAYLSFAGIVTFRRAEEQRRAAAMVPEDRLLVETDAPYLTPEPYRKIRRNEPCYVVETAKRLAQIRGTGYEALAAATTRNFRRLFDLPGLG